MRVSEVIDVSNIRNSFQLFADEFLEIFDCGHFHQHENAAIGAFPEFFGSGKAVVHATSSSLQLGSKRSAGEHDTILVVMIVSGLLRLFTRGADTKGRHIRKSLEFLAVWGLIFSLL
jgi:hypothetical protein